MDNGSLETLQGREVCWTGQVYHLSQACGDPAAFAVKWYKTKLITHFLCMGEQERELRLIPPQPCQGALGTVTAVSPVMQCSRALLCQALQGQPSLQPLSCLPHAREGLQGAHSPSAPAGAGTRHTECTAPQEQLALSIWQKILCRHKAADRSWVMGSSVLPLQFERHAQTVPFLQPGQLSVQARGKGWRRLRGSSRHCFYPCPVEVSMARMAPQSQKSINSLKIMY